MRCLAFRSIARISTFLLISATSAYFVVALFEKPPAPVEPCVLTVGGPSPLYACADNHSWQKLDGRWVDAGENTPVPEVPKS